MTSVGARANGRNGSGGWCDAAAAYPYRESTEGPRPPARRAPGSAPGHGEQASEKVRGLEQANAQDYLSGDNRSGGGSATATHTGRNKNYLLGAVVVASLGIYAGRVVHDWPVVEPQAEFAKPMIVDYRVIPPVWFER